MAGKMTEEFSWWLKNNGRWTEFKRRRVELEGQGLRRDEAWDQASTEFGIDTFRSDPSAVAEASKPASSPRATKAAPDSGRVKPKVFDGKESTLRGDYQWVYDNFQVEVKARDAPSSGAWGLLQFARSDPRSFYVEWMRMVGKTDDTDQQMRGWVQDASRTSAEIAEMLRTFRESLQPGPEGDRGEPGLEEGTVAEVGDGSGVPAGPA